jgi:hypothetical protein
MTGSKCCTQVNVDIHRYLGARLKHIPQSMTLVVTSAVKSRGSWPRGLDNPGSQQTLSAMLLNACVIVATQVHKTCMNTASICLLLYGASVGDYTKTIMIISVVITMQTIILPIVVLCVTINYKQVDPSNIKSIQCDELLGQRTVPILTTQA